MKLKCLALGFLFLLLNSPNLLVEADGNITPDGGSSSDGAGQAAAIKALMDKIKTLTTTGGSSSDGAGQDAAIKALTDKINTLMITVGSFGPDLKKVTDALTKMKADSKKLTDRVEDLEKAKPKKPASSSKTVPIVLLVILLVGAVVGAYYYAHKNGGIGVVAVRAFGAMRS
eukprot:851500_1